MIIRRLVSGSCKCGGSMREIGKPDVMMAEKKDSTWVATTEVFYECDKCRASICAYTIETEGEVIELHHGMCECYGKLSLAYFPADDGILVMIYTCRECSAKYIVRTVLFDDESEVSYRRYQSLLNC